MSQLDRDSQFTYNELQLFRELVFRRYIKELEAQRPFNLEDTIDVFELVSPESEPNRSGAKQSREETPIYAPDASVTASKQSAGLYGWVTSWFGGQQPETDAKDDDDQNKAALLDMWPKMEFQKLPPNLRRVEQNIEAEISDILSESWDDSTTLRRDALFAELVLQLEKMIIRFVDDDEVNFKNKSKN